MGFERAFAYLLFICLLIPWLPAQAQEVRGIRIVRGRGVIVKGNQSKARQKAIQSSLQQALEQAVADILEPEVGVTHLRVLQQNIYRRASQYVRSYRVIWEYPDLQQQVYRVELEVEVAIDAVTQAISRLGLSQADRGAWEEETILARTFYFPHILSKESRVACRV